MKFLKNQKGFTLVEILVVIAIIAILFITLLPQIDRAVDRSRQAGVKTDFRSFQLATETYLRETAGKGITGNAFNTYLDAGLHVGTNVTGAAGLDSLESDPWGSKYDVMMYPTNRMIIVQSSGPDEDHATTDDNFFLASYYINGTVGTCTTGFDSGDIVSELLKDEATKASITTWSCGDPIFGGSLGAVKADLN